MKYCEWNWDATFPFPEQMVSGLVTTSRGDINGRIITIGTMCIPDTVRHFTVLIEPASGPEGVVDEAESEHEDEELEADDEYAESHSDILSERDWLAECPEDATLAVQHCDSWEEIDSVDLEAWARGGGLCVIGNGRRNEYEGLTEWEERLEAEGHKYE